MMCYYLNVHFRVKELTPFPVLNYTEGSVAGLLYRVSLKTHNKCGQGTQLSIYTAGDV
jgi:hypothetical protein